MQTLFTGRLILRDWSPCDIDDFFALWSNPRLTLPEGNPPLATKEECMPLFRYLMMAKNNYAMVLRESGRVIGTLGLNEDAERDERLRNAGFMVNEDYWGRGLMKEALCAVIAQPPDGVLGLSCAHAAGNERVRRLVQSLGFSYAKIYPAVKRPKMDARDELYYVFWFEGEE